MKEITSIIIALVFALSINAQVNHYNNTITAGTNASAIGENNTCSIPQKCDEIL